MIYRALVAVLALIMQVQPAVEAETAPIPFETAAIMQTATPAEDQWSGADLGGAWLDVYEPDIPLILLDPIVMERPPIEWSLPTDWDLLTRQMLAAPHHDYPAADINMPVGTPVVAIRGGLITSATRSDGGACGGKVTISTDVGTFLYCHLSGVTVRPGEWVGAGWQVGLSGGRPGSTGSGSSTLPHLHIQYNAGRGNICPQPLLLSIWDQVDVNLSSTSRCIK